MSAAHPPDPRGTAHAGLVEIARDFVAAYRLARDIGSDYRAGQLDFALVRQLVGDDESSVLFRLKERCHTRFRPRAGEPDLGNPREALFDLAVGALFHEAMKFRETFYQREAYGPKVSLLRDELLEEAGDLFREFERILSAAALRLDEALHETESLLDQTREQFRRLLIEHRRDGFTTRYLIEHAADVEAVFPEGLDPLLAQIHGDAASGWALAGRSYLDSGAFEAAVAALGEACQRDPERSGPWRRMRGYAEGMLAYLHGRYEETVERIGAWLDGPPSSDERPYLVLAADMATHLGQLAEESGQPALREPAEALSRRLADLVPPPTASPSGF